MNIQFLQKFLLGILVVSQEIYSRVSSKYFCWRFTEKSNRSFSWFHLNKDFWNSFVEFCSTCLCFLSNFYFRLFLKYILPPCSFLKNESSNCINTMFLELLWIADGIYGDMLKSITRRVSEAITASIVCQFSNKLCGKFKLSGRCILSAEFFGSVSS